MTVVSSPDALGNSIKTGLILKLGHNKIMKLLFLVCLILSSPLYAQRSLNSLTYQANVRPILKGIISDFYQMVSLFPHFPDQLIPILERMDNLHTEKENLKEKCPRYLEKKCLGNINKLQEQLVSININLLKLIKELQITDSLHLNSLSGLKGTVNVQATTEELKGLLDNSSLFLKAQRSHKRLTHEIVKQIDEVSTQISLTLIDYVPFVYKEEFRQFYFNFVHPSQQHLGKKTGHEFLNQNIKNLNFSLNLLNQNLTKRSKKTPEGMAPYLLTIHNKWNSLLRYYY